MTSALRRIGAPRLAPAHQAELLDGSGISPDVAQRAGLRSCSDPQEIARLLNWAGPSPQRAWTDEYLPALVFPYGMPGEAEPALFRVKPRTPWPRHDKASGKVTEAKYLQPKGVGTRLYFPPDLLDDEQRRHDPAVPLLITEGEKKALSACSHGFACIGLSGVTCWGAKAERDGTGRRLGARRLHADFEHIELVGRQVFVVFDSDATDKREVRREESALGHALHAAGAEVHIVRLPHTEDGHKQGLDDFLVASGPTALSSLMESTARWRPALPGDDGRRVVVVDGDLEDRARTVLAAIAGENDPPWLFQSANGLVDVRARDGRASMRCLGERELRAHITGRLRFVEEKRGDDGTTETTLIDLSIEVYRHILAQPTWQLPRLDTVLHNPAFGPDGQLVEREGYHGEMALWADLGGFEIPSVPEAPTPADLARARALLIDELLGDFPFADEGSRAHAVALVLLPFVRPMIADCTPLHLISAPTPSTGKTRLAEALAIVATGSPPHSRTESRDDDEWRKAILSALLASPTVILIDNLKRKLNSPHLASILTTRTHTGRELGYSRDLTVRNDAVWVATGNNPSVSDEMARRSVEIRLDAKQERPWERDETKFRHQLPGWAHEARSDLVWACLTLVRAWLAAGRPRGAGTLGSYEEWARVMGGILDVAGIPGFLSNRARLHEAADAESAEWAGFVELWWDRHGGRSVTVADLLRLATEGQILDSVLAGRTEHGQRVALSAALKQRVDRVIGGHALHQGARDRRRKVDTYLLMPRDGAEPEGGDPANHVGTSEVEAQGAADCGVSISETTRLRTDSAPAGPTSMRPAESAESCGVFSVPPTCAGAGAHAHTHTRGSNTGSDSADSADSAAARNHSGFSHGVSAESLRRLRAEVPSTSPAVADEEGWPAGHDDDPGYVVDPDDEEQKDGGPAGPAPSQPCLPLDPPRWPAPAEDDREYI